MALGRGADSSRTSSPARRWWPPNRTNDHASTNARPSGLLGRERIHARDLDPERQAAASRQAVRPSVSCSLHRRCRASRLIHPVIYGGVDTKTYIVEVVGCGVAFLDYDNDGWLDLFVLSGTRLDAAPAGTTNRLYKNNRNGTFTDVTGKAGLTRTGWASAVTVGDYDNDGFDDLFITYYGQNVLYRNNGDGTFTDVTEKAGLRQDGVRYGGGCTWVDYDRDGRLDLFVANYLNTTIEKLPKPGESADCRWKGVPVNCGPRGLPTGYVQLYRNNGDGTFTDVSRQSGVAAAAGAYPMTAVAADYDNDGWPDIYVACDSTPSWLFRNQHDGTFRQEGLERGVALSEDGLEQAGMGVAVGDYDLDGNLDIFKTHFTDDTNMLYRNDGKGYFTDVTIRAGLGVETRYVGWGTGMVDLDNDGLPDLFARHGQRVPGDRAHAARLSLSARRGWCSATLGTAGSRS